jgi:four helix bundle protein
MAWRNYRDLIAWRKAMELTTQVYTATQQFPKEDLHALNALTQQLRQTAGLIPSSIAEGQERGSDCEVARSLMSAHASLQEVETRLMLAAQLACLPPDELVAALEKCAETGRLIVVLLRSTTDEDES